MITLATIVGYTVRKVNEYLGRAYVAYLKASDPEHYGDAKKGNKS